MTQRVLRETIDLIRRAGGSRIEVVTGGKHRRVSFLCPRGVERSVPIHTGSNPKRYEDSLRSELRRRGLDL